MASKASTLEKLCPITLKINHPQYDMIKLLKQHQLDLIYVPIKSF